MRENWLQEIAEYVNNQGTLVQEDYFEQVPVHHLSEPLEIRSKSILYIGANAIYSVDGKNFLYTELSDNEINAIYNSL